VALWRADKHQPGAADQSLFQADQACHVKIRAQVSTTTPTVADPNLSINPDPTNNEWITPWFDIVLRFYSTSRFNMDHVRLLEVVMGFQNVDPRVHTYTSLFTSQEKLTLKRANLGH
jgi:hypothetical protein